MASLSEKSEMGISDPLAQDRYKIYLVYFIYRYTSHNSSMIGWGTRKARRFLESGIASHFQFTTSSIKKGGRTNLN